MVVLLTMPDCSSGTKLPEMSSASACFMRLSSVLKALSTRLCVLGSRSGTVILKPMFGLASLPVIAMPHSTVRRVLTAVESAISGLSEAFVR